MKRQLLPSGMKDLSDGVAVWVDKKAGRDCNIHTSKDYLHGNVSPPQLDGDVFFVTVKHTIDLAQTMDSLQRTSIINIPTSDSAKVYSHMVLTSEITHSDEMGREDCVRVNVQFVPMDTKTRKTVSRDYVLSIRTHASHVIEVHRDDAQEYIHGMRKVVAHIGMELCSCPIVNDTISTPFSIMNMSVDECLEVISHMRLEKSEKEEGEISDEDDTMIRQMGIITRDHMLPPPPPYSSDTKISVYPVGMLFARQVAMIPGALKAVTFIKNQMPSYDRENASKIVLGAYNASKVLGKDENRIAFLEDIECEEMYHYAGKIACIGKQQFSFKWGSSAITLNYTQFAKGNCVFSFYRDGKMFAMSGMRHEMYKHISTYGMNRLSCVRCGLDTKYLKDMVDPNGSLKNHRQRFALQQSFIIQACILHPRELGPYKKMLRNLSYQWFHNRICHGMVDQERTAMYGSYDHFEEDKVCDGDICFMLASMNKLRRELNPHWWFVCNVH